jgi:hypothetical protein
MAKTGRKVLGGWLRTATVVTLKMNTRRRT